MKVHQIVPISIYESTIPVKDSWLTYAKSSEFERVPIDNGYFTKNKYVLNDLVDLKDLIKVEFEKFIRKYYTVKSHIKFDFQNSWINKHLTNDWAQEHAHLNSMFSGVYYLNNENNMGDITFKVSAYDNPVTKGFGLEYEKEHTANSNLYTLKPSKGTLYIFPSYLLHYVSANLTDKDRYTLAFNLFLKDSKFGTPQSIIEV